MSKLYLAFLTLSDHAARKSGNARRKPGTSFSDAIRGALGRYAAQSSGGCRICFKISGCNSPVFT